MDRSSLTKEQRWLIADRLAEDRLEDINKNEAPVTVRKTFYSEYVKRAIDILVSGVALTITLPINVLIGIITFFDVGRPIFFSQERTGRYGKTFRIIKFRNMTNERDKNGELLPAAKRVTKFGKFVRKTSLDELLNFWSVFKGDMSLIGPRPLVPEYEKRYSRRHRARLAARPGLECPPRSIGNHVFTWQEQFENDVWYVENISFRTDVMQLVMLVRFALDKKSSEARATVSEKGIFMGYSKDGKAINLNQVEDSYIEAVLKDTGKAERHSSGKAK